MKLFLTKIRSSFPLFFAWSNSEVFTLVLGLSMTITKMFLWKSFDYTLQLYVVFVIFFEVGFAAF